MVAEAREREEEEEEEEEEEGAGAVAGVGVVFEGAVCGSKYGGRWSGSRRSRDSKAWMIWGLVIPERRRRWRRSICSMV